MGHEMRLKRLIRRLFTVKSTYHMTGYVENITIKTELFFIAF